MGAAARRLEAMPQPSPATLPSPRRRRPQHQTTPGRRRPANRRPRPRRLVGRSAHVVGRLPESAAEPLIRALRDGGDDEISLPAADRRPDGPRPPTPGETPRQIVGQPAAPGLATGTACVVLRAADLAKSGTPGPEGSLGKILWTEGMRTMTETVSSILGPKLIADTGEWGTFEWGEHVLGAPGYRIAGGSDEVQRNIIGERVLGLPREPRADSGAWKDILR